MFPYVIGCKVTYLLNEPPSSLSSAMLPLCEYSECESEIWEFRELLSVHEEFEHADGYI